MICCGRGAEHEHSETSLALRYLQETTCVHLSSAGAGDRDFGRSGVEVVNLTNSQYEALQAIAGGRSTGLTHYMLRVLRRKRLVREGYIELTARGKGMLTVLPVNPVLNVRGYNP